MDELIKAIEKLTEEVKKLQAARAVEYHYHYNYTLPQYIQPQYISPTIPPPYPITCGGITSQPAT